MSILPWMIYGFNAGGHIVGLTMQHELELLEEEVTELERTVSVKSRKLHDCMSELKHSYDENILEIEAIKEEKEALKLELVQLEQDYTALQQDNENLVAPKLPLELDHSEDLLPPVVLAASMPEKKIAIQIKPEPVQSDSILSEPVIEKNKQKPVVNSNGEQSWTEEGANPSFQFQPYLTFLISILAPLQLLFARIAILNNVYDQLVGAFKHYKNQGKMAVFLMTVSGIMLLVIGFAYILQYSFVQLSLEWKLFFCFVVAAAVVLLGVRLHVKKEEMQDYAAALIGLGMILAYLSAYFMGTAYSLVEQWVAFVVLAFLTCMAYLLAHMFNTRIVALVSLIGGACLPLLGEGQGWLTLVYPGYLLLLNATSMNLAYKIRWAPLSYIAFMLSAAMLEYQFSQGMEVGSTFSIVFLSVVLHLFFYLYLTHSYHLLTTSAKAKGAMLMTANLALFISLLPQVLHTSLLGGLFIINASVLGVVFFKKYLNNDLQRSSMLLLQSALFLALAILSWVDERYMALLWGIEALLLLYMGLIFQLRSIRYEAYVLMLVALLQSAWQCAIWFGSSAWALQGLALGWWMLLSIGVFLQAVLMLLSRFEKKLNDSEVPMMQGIRESISCWLVIMVMATSYMINNQVYLLVALPLMLVLFYRTTRFQLRITEVIAWLLWLLPLSQINISVNEAGSMLFMEVNWVGKIAILESFALLWLVSAFYIRHYPQSKWSVLAEPMRAIFYLLIPICFLLGIWQNAPSWVPAVLWVSALLSFILFLWKKMTILYLEQMLLSAVAVVSTISVAVFANDFPLTQLIISLGAGLSYFTVIIVYYRALHLRDHKHSHRWLFITAFYYAGLCCLLLVSSVFESLAAGLLAAQLYIVRVLWISPVFQPLRTQLGFWHQAALMIPLLMIAIVVLGHESGVGTFLLWPSVLLSLMIVHIKRRHFCVLWNFRGSYAEKLVFSHFCLLSVYTVYMSIWYHDVFQAAWSVLLVLHATLMLFESLWPRFIVLLRASSAVYVFVALKILFYDLHDLSMIEKVVAFVFMGSALLLAAYSFQRLKTRLNKISVP